MTSLACVQVTPTRPRASCSGASSLTVSFILLGNLCDLSILLQSESSDWIRVFKLPTQFSLMTMKALESANKMQITSAIRCEIISSIATLVMVHTMYPTPENYTVLAQRLVTEHPILADGYGCGYVSRPCNDAMCVPIRNAIITFLSCIMFTLFWLVL